MSTLTRYKTTALTLFKDKEIYVAITYLYDGKTLALIKAEDISKVDKKEKLRINLWAMLSPKVLQALLESCLEDELTYMSEENFDEVDHINLEDLLAAAEYYDKIIRER